MNISPMKHTSLPTATTGRSTGRDVDYTLTNRLFTLCMAGCIIDLHAVKCNRGLHFEFPVTKTGQKPHDATR